jgi:heme/copper-type cytochrome/quinol oxidase subunit 3
MGGGHSVESTTHHSADAYSYGSHQTQSSGSTWFYLAMALSLAFFGLQYMKYLANKEQLVLKEEKLR